MISDNDLMMIENLTTLDGDNNIVSYFKAKPLNQCENLKDFLNQFDETKLSILELQNGGFNGAGGYHEWAAMIRYMKGKPEITRLKIVGETKRALCFEDPSEPERALVFFRGTMNDEWEDNVYGLNSADTDSQLEAYEYIEGLPDKYKNITVAGHSKGGNKAQYVAIRCDRVDRCVSVDGQGFSKEFYEKYSGEVYNNAHKIKNYSLENDFVHFLLFAVPGAQQIYIHGGDDVHGTAEIHSISSIFEYENNNGTHTIKVDENGEPVLPVVSQEDPSITMLRKFIEFIMNNSSGDEKELIVAMLAPLLHGIIKGNWDSKQITDHIMKHLKGTAIIIAYLLKFIKLYEVTVDDILKMFLVLNIDVIEIVQGYLKDKNLTREQVKDIIDQVVDKGINVLTNGRDEKFFKFLAGCFGGGSIVAIWNEIENAYGAIHITSGWGSFQIKIRDYSVEVSERLNDALNAFGNNYMQDVSSWTRYSSEDWFGKLMIAIAAKIVNGYAERVARANQKSRIRITNTFNNIISVDKKYSKKTKDITKNVSSLRMKIKMQDVKIINQKVDIGQIIH